MVTQKKCFVDLKKCFVELIKKLLDFIYFFHTYRIVTDHHLIFW
jgi:hypothetical protein